MAAIGNARISPKTISEPRPMVVKAMAVLIVVMNSQSACSSLFVIIAVCFSKSPLLTIFFLDTTVAYQSMRIGPSIRLWSMYLEPPALPDSSDACPAALLHE